MVSRGSIGEPLRGPNWRATGAGPSICSAVPLEFRLREPDDRLISRLDLAAPLAETLAAGPARQQMSQRKALFAALSSVERTGIEPVTSGLQSRRSPS